MIRRITCWCLMIACIATTPVIGQGQSDDQIYDILMSQSVETGGASINER